MNRVYTVRGRWPFPTDMLRHDEARAAGPQEQHLIDRMSGEASDNDFGTRVPVSIILVMEAGEPCPGRPNGRFLPNDQRWRSYGWEVVGVPEIDGEREEAKAAGKLK